jgi:SNF2 family DNA or RNA helicase
VIAVLRDYQRAIVNFIQENNRCGIWASMGAGKGLATLTALDQLDLVEDIYPVLVIAPLRVASMVWSDEVRKWDHLQHLRVSTIIGTADERRAALTIKADIYTINLENIPWLREQLGDRWPYQTVVVDESSKLNGFRLRQGTQRSKALGQVAHTRMALTLAR